jgi:phosphate uptake regulator
MADLRKIQSTQTGTLFVSLPKSWSEGHGFRKGTLVALSETGDGRIFIDPKYNDEPTLKSTSLIVGPYLGRKIVGHYLLGSDIIRIETKERIDLETRSVV